MKVLALVVAALVLIVAEAGVAPVPGSSFFSDPADGSRFIRCCFAKKRETLEEAGARLAKL